VACLVAREGRSVTLFERETEPQFRIGESLIPGTYWTLERLGMLDEMKASSFPRKYSVQFYNPAGRASAPFYFNEFEPHESSITWQVLRSEFDPMLRRNAERNGAEVVLGASAQDVLFDGDRVCGVRVKLDSGEARDYTARVVVDATGQSALISRKLKMGGSLPELKKAAVFSHFHNARRDTGIDEGATLVIHTSNENGWFWYIPMPNNRVSVGVVGDIDYLFGDRSLEPQAIFDREVGLCGEIRDRLTHANQVFPIKVRKDFSYRSHRNAGNGWLLVGDAYAFLDPIYSTGLLLAFKSGEMAADAIDDAFKTNDFSPELLGRYREEFDAGMNSLKRIVYAYYCRGFSFGKFLRAHPECRQGIIDMLSGNVYRRDVTAVFEPLAEMCDFPAGVI
jgi:flavin-dependent dehydrogenase